MRVQGLTIVVYVCLTMTVTVAFGSKILKMPKIYNALITSKEKILPSEAYPAATGPIFQPIGLSGTPILIHPEIDNSELFNVKEGDKVKTFFGKSKVSQPLTFFPRYSVYYPNQPHLLLHYPFFLDSLEDLYLTDELRVNHKGEQSSGDQQLENEEKKDLILQKSKHHSHPSEPSRDFLVDYVKNNRPLDRNIPDIPPPPPPIRYKGPE